MSLLKGQASENFRGVPLLRQAIKTNPARIPPMFWSCVNSCAPCTAKTTIRITAAPRMATSEWNLQASTGGSNIHPTRATLERCTAFFLGFLDLGA